MTWPERFSYNSSMLQIAKASFRNSSWNLHDATIQAYFRLPKPVSELVPHIGRLEYDIYNEIGVPNSKVAILSMHQPSASNWTNVVFGILSDPIDVSINPVSLSLLRSSLVELFVQESNLTLTRIFGQPSSFEILKFAGGITLIPEQSAGISDIPLVLFNFTLNNSIQQIKDNFADLKEQLKLGLHLRSYESIYMLVTNRIGSTRDPPVTVQASVKSYTGIPLPQRLRQLAQLITGSPVENLGLDNSVFGKVKEISLSSFLNNTLHATPPSPSPAPGPAPGQDDYTDLSPSYPPAASSPDNHHQFAPSPSDDSYPFPPSPENSQNSVPPISSVAPSMVDAHTPHPSPHSGSALVPSPPPTFDYDSAAPSSFSADAPGSYPPSVGSTPPLSPYLPPLPLVSYDSRPRQDRESGKKLASPPHASPTISAFPS
ncbi:verprolin isoform X2 [Diospyros lotus]|uniref:verprolin isoform X2 n=2 Tax=Diospyros lotus TaxID=55363 RepID=UPI00225878A8|nr:verprolin isoform X2 [Diospyros lotus]